MHLGSAFHSTTIATDGAEIFVAHGGKGPPLVLLHGYPQTHLMWHRQASSLAQRFHVICPDLRGYGQSAKPEGVEAYSKRVMAGDVIKVVETLGYRRFQLAGHDRGARVGHRLLLDHPDRVERACFIDIAPTYQMFQTADQDFATAYYHWFFLIQPDGLPERMIGADPAYYLREKLRRWSGPEAIFDEKVVDAYLEAFCKPDTIRATCDDYRAAAGIDLEHDRLDQGRQIETPLLILWGAQGFIARRYDVLSLWRQRACEVHGQALPGGHFVPEEAPAQTLEAFFAFFRS